MKLNEAIIVLNKHNYLVEKAKTPKNFIQYMIDNGETYLNKNEDGSFKYKYVLAKLNDSTIKMTDKFKQQLIDEGLYNRAYCTFITAATDTAPYNMQQLPIYGDPNRYITKWFKYYPEDAIKADLRDKYMNLKGRSDWFNNPEI